MSLKLNTKYLKDFVNADELTGIKAQVEAAAQSLQSKTGLGNDFLGWLDLPTAYDKEEFARIKAAAEKIKANSQYEHSPLETKGMVLHLTSVWSSRIHSVFWLSEPTWHPRNLATCLLSFFFF